jgi:SAM-dependent methyltransferase
MGSGLTEQDASAFDERHAPLTEPDQDVPYAEDLQSPEGAKAWVDEADRKRPLRLRIRHTIVDRLAALPPGARVLELGSGPGFLAEQILNGCTDVAHYTLFDFSEPMLDMSRNRVAQFPTATFVLGDFRSRGWTQNLSLPYEAVVSMQAVHEVRHKRHVPRLYQEIYNIVAANGIFLIADRVPDDDSARSRALFMTAEEQTVALNEAGFMDVHVMMEGDALVLCECRKPVPPFSADAIRE